MNPHRTTRELIGPALLAHVADGARAARRRGRPVLVALMHSLAPGTDPLALAAAMNGRAAPFFLWSHARRPVFRYFALGAAVTFSVDHRGALLHDADGQNLSFPPGEGSRFSAAGAACSWIFEGALCASQTRLARPRFVGGFSFDPETGGDAFLPAARLWLPRIAFARQGTRTIATLSALVHPGDDPDALTAALLGEVDAFRDGPAKREREAPTETRIAAAPAPAAWKRLVALARRRIGAGEFEKVVLARRFRLTGPRPFDIPSLHARLSERFPSSFVLALGQGSDAFVAATPELLVRKTGRRVYSGSLAGSMARGRTPSADRRLAQALLESKKEQGEHAIVLRAIRQVLGPRCSALESPNAPSLVRLENVHHLHTPVTGLLRRPESVLSLVEALHPTPAVSGYPREPALGMIREVERFDRGWYAGPVGWLDAAGDGEFAVAIRSGRIRGREADLYAGAGLVQDSEPEAELKETRAKLRALLDDLLEL